MADRIQHRRDTKARWAEYNPILLEGEVGYVSDNPNQYKIGDGEHHWNDLPLRGFDGNIVQGTGDDEEAVMSQKATTEKLNALDEKISKETTDRGTAITTAINKEVSDRNTAIKTAIDKEVVDRNNVIAAETKSRQEADNALKKEVDDIKEDMGHRSFLRGGEYMQVTGNDITLQAFCPDGTSLVEDNAVLEGATQYDAGLMTAKDKVEHDETVKKTNSILTCNGILENGASAEEDGLYLRKNEKGKITLLTKVTGGMANSFSPETGKFYLCDGLYYGYTGKELVPIGGGTGSGSGSGFYNVTKEIPLSGGYYTKDTAVAALAEADIDDDAKLGMIITFEAEAGKWLDYRFEGTDTSSFLEPSAWNRYGGGDAIKKIKVTKGTATEELTPDEQGGVSIEIPVVEVDQSVNENSTNPVSGKGVAAKINEKAATYGTAVRLNEIGDGDDKAYSLSLLNEEGDVISTSDMFTGGGGSGTVATTKVSLTRITPNKTVKSGDEVKLTYKYDQTDTTTGESTGNPGRVTVTVTQGANTNTMTQTVAAGSTNTIDVTKYMGVGTNTVRVRVEVGEGAEMQVAQVTWSINVVQLTLTSSFNIATAITRGQTLNIPYALNGAGEKTLRCYVDGTDTEDRSVTSSTANGSFAINTSNLSHGTHTVQLVVELELSDGSVIKSNSIFFAVGIRETGNNTPLVSARFDYADGTIIEKGSTPYIPAKQFDNYTLQYAAYNPRETPTKADVYVGDTLASSASVAFTAQNLTLRATEYGEQQCRIVVGARHTLSD